MEQIEHCGAILAYKKIGEGENVVILFYGYAQNNAVFDALTAGLLESHTFYIVDLFFHGKSVWKSNEKLNNFFWLSLFMKFIEQTKLKSFDLIGYSLGGKFALLTYEGMPTRVKSIYLIAPDGLYEDFWNTLFTSNKLMLRVLKFTLSKWSFFRLLPYISFKIGLISKNVYSFVLINLDTKAKREMLYNCWSVFKDIKLPLTDLSTQIRKHYTSVNIYLGKQDEIIKEKHLKWFCTKAKRVQLTVLEANHYSILNESLKVIKKNIKM